MPVALGILPPATLAPPCASRAQDAQERPLDPSYMTICEIGHYFCIYQYRKYRIGRGGYPKAMTGRK